MPGKNCIYFYTTFIILLKVTNKKVLSFSEKHPISKNIGIIDILFVWIPKKKPYKSNWAFTYFFLKILANLRLLSLLKESLIRWSKCIRLLLASDFERLYGHHIALGSCTLAQGLVVEEVSPPHPIKMAKSSPVKRGKGWGGRVNQLGKYTHHASTDR